MHKKVKLGTFLLLVLGLTELHGQSTVTGSGANAAGSGGSASYTLGQITYTTIYGTTGSAAQGIQQPYEISVVNGRRVIADSIQKAQREAVSDTAQKGVGIDLVVYAYPNPTTDFLNLIVDKSAFENLIYQLSDINGKIIESKKVESNETRIMMGQFLSSTYFLKVLSHNIEIKTFKIIKN